MRGGVSDWLVAGLREDGRAERAVGGQVEGTGSGRFVRLEKGMEVRDVVERIKKHIGVKQGMNLGRTPVA